VNEPDLIERRVGLAVALNLAAVFCFASMDTGVKWLVSGSMTALQITWLRYLFHFLWVLVLFLPAQRMALFKAKQPLLQAFRGSLLFLGTVFNFAALNYLPLTVTIAIFFAAPLIVCLLSIPVLGEKVGIRRLSAVAVGFIGVLVIVEPWNEEFNPAIGLSLLAVLCVSGYFVMSRRMAGVDSNAIMQCYTAGLATVILTPVVFIASPFDGTQDAQSWLLAALIGSLGMLGHSLLTRAHRFAEASVLAPTVYSQMLYIIVFSWIFFSETPTLTTMVGTSIIVASGLYLWLRERGTSALSAAAVTTSSASLGIPCEYRGRILATESRPADAGRIALVMQRQSGEFVDCLSDEYSVRTRVHEYGGRAWWAGREQLYFCQWSDQRLYVAAGNADALKKPIPITPEPLSQHGLRFADGIETADGRWVIAVAEVHGDDRTRLATKGSTQQRANITTANNKSPSSTEPHNIIVAIPTDGSAAGDASQLVVLVDGADFMSNPRLSPCGRYLSWLQWFHPNMPWDVTELWLAELHSDENHRLSATAARQCDGGKNIAIVGPQWTQAGELVYSSDVSGWWNLYTYKQDTQQVSALTHLTGSEIGAAAWVVGTTRFVELQTGANAERCLAVAITEQASDSVAILHSDGSLAKLPLACASVRGLSATKAGGLLVLAEQRDAESAHFHFTAPDIAHSSAPQKLGVGSSQPPQELTWSIAEPISFPSGDSLAHAFFYPPGPLHTLARPYVCPSSIGHPAVLRLPM